MRALAYAMVLAASAPAPIDEDPIEAAHAKRDPAHVMTAVRVESEIEDLNKHTVTVFGARREYRCPGGELAQETRCDPCTYPRDAWAEHPANEWVVEQVYGTEAEHQAATKAMEHFGRYFELELRPGVESAGKQHVFAAYSGHTRAAPPPSPVAKLKVLVGGAERDTALIPFGSKDVEIDVQALRRNPSGALEPMPEARIDFSTPCALLRPTGEGKVLASLEAGTNSCVVTATGNPGSVSAFVTVARELKVEILFEGQAADEVRLQHARALDLTFSAVALDKKVAIEPQWKGEHGTFELFEGGQKVRFTLDTGHDEGSVRLLDSRSGASDTLSVKRQP